MKRDEEERRKKEPSKDKPFYNDFKTTKRLENLILDQKTIKKKSCLFFRYSLSSLSPFLLFFRFSLSRTKKE